MSDGGPSDHDPVTEQQSDMFVANQRYLSAALSALSVEIRQRLQDPIDCVEAASCPENPEELANLAREMPGLPALEAVTGLFSLTHFERDLLLLCAGAELDPFIQSLIAEARGDPARTSPTCGLVLRLLSNGSWSSLSPGATLRYWRLIEMETGRAYIDNTLRIDERILFFLLGIPCLDERLTGYLSFMGATDLPGLVPGHEEIAEAIWRTWSGPVTAIPNPIQLSGRYFELKKEIFTTACIASDRLPFRLAAHSIPVQPAEQEALVRLCTREMLLLLGGAIYLDGDDLQPQDTQQDAAFRRVCESLCCRRVIARTKPVAWPAGTTTIEVGAPDTQEQKQIWMERIGALCQDPEPVVGPIVAQFGLDPAKIRSVTDGVLDYSAELSVPPNPQILTNTLWDACRASARSGLDDLAERIVPKARWDQLVLPDRQRAILRMLAGQVRQRMQVYDTWGFAERSSRGLGISALFAGLSGTGKTMAAEVLANDLRLDLYRIDLSQVVSKYIGETEKNLRRVFDAAEGNGAVLLFDEADALFGRRSEVRDSHDRYANIEVSYLLQRMEAYRGLAILTTNMREAIDSAFLRRIRFIVQFPFPDQGQRREIWERIFPEATPTEDLDWEKLSRLNVTGGTIRNIALHAAFIAADKGTPVRMADLLQATKTEMGKAEREVSEAEVARWVAPDSKSMTYSL